MATKEVRIPFWSHANGMKDIIWYTPTPGRRFIYCNSQSQWPRKRWWQSTKPGLLCGRSRPKQSLSRKPLLITKSISSNRHSLDPKTTIRIQEHLMSSSRMSTVLKGCRLCKFLLGLIRDGQDDIRWYEATHAKRTEITRVSVKASDHKELYW